MTDSPGPCPQQGRQDDPSRSREHSQNAWEQLRSYLEIGQQLAGRVIWVPRPGAIGIGVDLSLPIGGFVDVLLMPFDAGRWPAEGTVTDFKIWWMDDRSQIRLLPAESIYRREDFDSWILQQPGRERFHP